MLWFVSFKIVVHCGNERIQLRRLLSRNVQLSDKQAKSRIESQMKMQIMLKLADYVIDNSGEFIDTEKQVKNVFNILNKSKTHLKIKFYIIFTSGLIFCGLYILGKFAF